LSDIKQDRVIIQWISGHCSLNRATAGFNAATLVLNANSAWLVTGAMVRQRREPASRLKTIIPGARQKGCDKTLRGGGRESAADFTGKISRALTNAATTKFDPRQSHALLMARF